MTSPAVPPSAPARVALPTSPEQARRQEFPLLASVAPVIGSVVMWAITQSAFALVFAFLGPVIAIASLLDAKRHGHKSERAERARFAHEVQATLAIIESEHTKERRALVAAAKEPTRLLAGTARDPEWWRGSLMTPVLVCLGRGTVASSLVIDGTASLASGRDSDVEASFARLRQAAAELQDAPVIVDARDGIGIIGPTAPAEALARAIVVQLISGLSPTTVTVTESDGGAFGWLAALPHPRASGRRVSVSGPAARVGFRSLDADVEPGQVPEIACVVARHEHELPRECRVVVRIGGGTAEVVSAPGGMPVHHLRPLYVSEAQALAFVERVRESATAEGMVRAGAALPELLAFESLEHTSAPSTGRLPGMIAQGADGPVTIDLVTDGPHAIVGGTTGSGKSELLVSWVLAMAAATGPDEVNFLLVDFKGGSSFTAVEQLPHTVGLITDLDERSASRALSSLRAELRYRERALASAGVRAIGELGEGNRLPRLVIAVDEFAVVVGDYPELHALFADLAARGRSLGVHLILCTQRPGGVVRDVVLANCTLRLSLRVNNRADSAAVIGTGAAAALPRHPFGRCYISVGGGVPEEVQVALAGESDVAAVVQRWSSTTTQVRRPWCDPLPDRVLSSSLAPVEVGLPFGLTDLPEEQSQPTAVYDPERQGNLIAIGGHASGKSGLLAALADSAGAHRGAHQVVSVENDVEGAWDQVVDALARLSLPSTGSRIYLLDDVDALLDRFGEDHHHAFSEMLARLLREGPGAGSRMVLTAGRLTSAAQSLATLCDSRLILRMPTRQEHLLVGGDAGDFYSSELPPGAGFWQGHRVQIAWVPESSLTESRLPESQSVEGLRELPSGRPPVDFGNGAGFAIVTTRPHVLAERLRACTPAGSVVELAAQASRPVELTIGEESAGIILVADPSTWQSQWGFFAAARTSLSVLFDGCTVAELRALTGSRTLPPPIGTTPGGVWLLGPDGVTTRAQLPPGAIGSSVDASAS